jgi:hypothetical protein
MSHGCRYTFERSSPGASQEIGMIEPPTRDAVHVVVVEVVVVE